MSRTIARYRVESCRATRSARALAVFSTNRTGGAVQWRACNRPLTILASPSTGRIHPPPNPLGRTRLVAAYHNALCNGSHGVAVAVTLARKMAAPVPACGLLRRSPCFAHGHPVPRRSGGESRRPAELLATAGILGAVPRCAADAWIVAVLCAGSHASAKEAKVSLRCRHNCWNIRVAAGQ